MSTSTRLAATIAGGLLIAATCGAAEVAAAEETALARQKAPAPREAAERKPLTLHIAVNDIYCRKTACECLGDVAARSFDTMLAELKSRHNITLEMTYFMEVFDLHKAVLSNQYDGMLCKPWTALQFGPRTGACFKRVADLLDPDNQAFMSGMFLTTADSPIRSLADIQGRRIALGQADSYEKHQEPLRMLAAANIKPSAIRLFSSCGENLGALMDGEVDVAVVSSYALTATCAVDFAKPEDFRTIAETAKMPLTSLLVDLKKVPAADAARLQAALLDVSGEHAPEGCGKSVLSICRAPPGSKI